MCHDNKTTGFIEGKNIKVIFQARQASCLSSPTYNNFLSEMSHSAHFLWKSLALCFFSQELCRFLLGCYIVPFLKNCATFSRDVTLCLFLKNCAAFLRDVTLYLFLKNCAAFLWDVSLCVFLKNCVAFLWDVSLCIFLKNCAAFLRDVSLCILLKNVTFRGFL